MSSLLENCIYVAESEGKMFDTLINLEFADVLREADLSDQEEDSETGNGSVQADVEADGDPVTRDKFKEFKATVKIKLINIGKKIQEVLEKVWNVVSNAFKNVIEKITDFFTSDKQIVAKYRNAVLDEKNYNGFEGIENFMIPKANANEVPPAIAATMNKIVEENKLIMNSKDQSDIDYIKKTIDGELNEYLEKLNNYYGDCFETVQKWMPNKTFMQEAIDFMDSNETSNKIRKYFLNEISNVKSLINKLRNSAKVDMLLAKLNNSENGKLELAKATVSFDIMAKASSAISKYAKLSITVNVARLKAYRHAILTVGKFATSQGESEGSHDTTQEAVDFRYILGETSDMAIEEAFAWI